MSRKGKQLKVPPEVKTCPANITGENNTTRGDLETPIYLYDPILVLGLVAAFAPSKGAWTASFRDPLQNHCKGPGVRPRTAETK